MQPIRIVEFIGDNGCSAFGDWFAELDLVAAAKVTIAVSRIERGAMSNVKPVGGGVSEYRIDYGPGYRIYFGMDGPVLVILLGGGTKKRQQRDIDAATSAWNEYKRRKAT